MITQYIRSKRGNGIYVPLAPIVTPLSLAKRAVLSLKEAPALEDTYTGPLSVTATKNDDNGDVDDDEDVEIIGGAVAIS